MNSSIIKIETSRLVIHLSNDSEMRTIIQKEKDEEIKFAYMEMLENCRRYPNKRKWYALWLIALKDNDNIFVGSMSFKGLSVNGCIEIGYGIESKYQGNGYASEAVTALTQWAVSNPEVTSIEAETESDNVASQRVLIKSGFVPNGEIGNEGPRFVLKHKN